MRRQSQQALANVLGKTIDGLVFTVDEEGNPRSQLFIAFTDGTSLELYSNSDVICSAGSLDDCRLASIKELQTKRNGTKVITFGPEPSYSEHAQRNLFGE